MRTGPVRRAVAVSGLLLLVPIAVLLLMGNLHPVDAAGRALAVLLVAFVLIRVLEWGVRLLAANLERRRPTVAKHHPRRDETAGLHSGA